MIKITQALPEESIAILHLQKLAYQSEAELYGDFSIPPLTQTLDELTGDFKYKIFLKAQVESKFVGSVRGHQVETTGLIERLIVHPDFQGQGIGTALMAQIELRFDSVQRFELFTGDRSDRNIRLYNQLGYQMFKREIVHENLSFVFMEKCPKQLG
jgi:GNAT superfamily N-acetyltransferase